MSKKNSPRPKHSSHMQDTRPRAIPRSKAKRNAKIEAKVSKAVDRLLSEPLKTWPFTSDGLTPWPQYRVRLGRTAPWASGDLGSTNRGPCPVCKCPDFENRLIEHERHPAPHPGIVVVGFQPRVPEPTHRWVCKHCDTDRTFFSSLVMWAELLELRESVVVDGLAYEEFCEKELELFDRYLSEEDIAFSDRMMELSDFVKFTMANAGQPRTPRTGLLIRRFQIKQWLAKNQRSGPEAEN